MLKNRLIPVLLLKNGRLVRSETFKVHQVIGNPLNEVERFNEWMVDELIYLDITREGEYDQLRDDQKNKSVKDPLEILRLVSKTCFMPLTWGGRIRSVEDMRLRFRNGADKITLNTAAFDDPGLVTAGATLFGNQAIVASVDVFRHDDGRYEVVVDGGRRFTGAAPDAWAVELEKLGAGEILLQSVNRDGAGTGYDLALVSLVAGVTNIPVIACSGVGRFEDYAKAVKAGASAAAAANIWHFKELADRQGKRALLRAGVNVRMEGLS